MKRRTLIAAAGLGAAATAGAGLWFNARQARLRGEPMRALNETQRAALEAFGEALLPGARDAGVAHFVDAQLAGPPEDCLLTLRYFDWPPPYLPFYAGGLAALDAAARAARGADFAGLDAGQADALVGAIASNQIANWQGPPAPLFYLAARSDAVDVVYGTMEGFEKLGIPYMAHIEPRTPW